MTQVQVNQLLQSAMIAAQNGRYEEVKSNCLQIIDIEPNNPHALHMLGKVAETSQNLAQAISYYKQVASIHEDEHIYMSIAILYQNGEEYELAINAYEKVLAINPSYSMAARGIRVCAEHDSLHMNGLNALTNIAKNHPSATSAAMNYFQLYQHKVDTLIEGDEFETAINDLIALVQEANFLPVSFMSAKLLVQKGGMQNEVSKSFADIEEILMLCIGAMGYLFNQFHNDAEQIATVLYVKLHDYLALHPDDNRAWRVLSLTTGVFKDKNEGNRMLREFLSNLPDEALHLSAFK